MPVMFSTFDAKKKKKIQEQKQNWKHLYVSEYENLQISIIFGIVKHVGIGASHARGST